MGDLMEYPPTYCDGRLFVNLERGRTVALDAATGKVIWSRARARADRVEPGDRRPERRSSAPTAAPSRPCARATGRSSGSCGRNVPVESSPVAVGGTVYVGASDGRLFALAAGDGHDTLDLRLPGPDQLEPVRRRRPRVHHDVHGRRRAAFTARDGDARLDPLLQARRVPLRELLLEPVERRAARLRRGPHRQADRDRCSTGDTLWTYRTGALTYGTPSVANGRVFVADLAGEHRRRPHAPTATRLWRAHVPGRVLGPTLVVGNLVFFSTLEGQTYAARVTDGRIVWHFRAGKYAPGIATEKHYYLSLNGLLAAFAGRRTTTP